MKKYAVIVAGGNGLRMGSDTPKQFMLLNGKTVLEHTIATFIQTYSDLQVILVLPRQHIDKGNEIIVAMNVKQRVTITDGGETRFHSVKNGLALVTDPSVIFVHDGVRCMVSEALIERCYEQAIVKGSAIPAIAAIDSIRMVEQTHHHIVDRNKVRIIQTPQTFLSSVLLPAFQQQYNDLFTDEATVVEASGQPVFLIEGEYNNIKITRPIDLCIAENLLKDGSTL